VFVVYQFGGERRVLASQTATALVDSGSRGAGTGSGTDEVVVSRPDLQDWPAAGAHLPICRGFAGASGYLNRCSRQWREAQVSSSRKPPASCSSATHSPAREPGENPAYSS
jgi:hypothetical protein